MLLDDFNMLSSAQAVTTTALSTNSIDKKALADLGVGTQMFANVFVPTACAGAGTVTFQVVESDNANLSSPTILAQTDAIGYALLTAGREPINIPIPPSAVVASPRGKRYIGLQYTVTGGPLTGGAFTAYVSDQVVTSQKSYPSGFTVA
jgi:hypothetical protein